MHDMARITVAGPSHRARRLPPQRVLVGLGVAASLLFAWEYGMVFGLPLPRAGRALAWRRT